MSALKKPLADRWWYHPPWERSRPWKLEFSVYSSGGDEYCNPTVYIGLPFLGAWVVRYKPGPIRTKACDKCQAEYGPWCLGCESCHRGPRCHPWGLRPHDDTPQDCPTCGGGHCPACEPESKKTCLAKGQT